VLNNKIKSKRGFTLIELIVSIAILAILYPTISAAFLDTQAIMTAENSKLDTMSKAQLILQELQVEGRDNIENIRKNYSIEETQRSATYRHLVTQMLK
jgi:prepilin-type N-terminal cleavage/methylation domain-containing protein